MTTRDEVVTAIENWQREEARLRQLNAQVREVRGRRNAAANRLIEIMRDNAVDAFELNGFVVENREDIDTYPRWIKRNRQVHWKERSTLLISDKPAPQVCYFNGHTVLDERTGKPKIRTFKKRYYLFHIDQTREQAPVKTYKIPTT